MTCVNTAWAGDDAAPAEKSAWVGPRTLRGVALASLIANVTIVITGGAVRLTGSGLGCPTWPSCTSTSFVPTQALGIHGVIEFSNRTVAGVLGVIAVAGLIVALLQRPRRARQIRLAALIFLSIPAQAIMGKITVQTDLNPWVVASHFLLSIGIIAAAYAFWRATQEGDGPPRPVVQQPLRVLAAGLLVVAGVAITLGTVVTGSGPHAGDERAPRNGLDPAAVTQLHADSVFVLVGLAVATWFAFRAAGARDQAVRAAWLIAVLVAQAAVGFTQYLTGLPALLVGVHLAGAAAVWIAALSVWYSTRTRETVADAVSAGTAMIHTTA
jgi:cytochrome c oxidase assembly protein subunit 15